MEEIIFWVLASIVAFVAALIYSVVSVNSLKTEVRLLQIKLKSLQEAYLTKESHTPTPVVEQKATIEDRSVTTQTINESPSATFANAETANNFTSSKASTFQQIPVSEQVTSEIPASNNKQGFAESTPIEPQTPEQSINNHPYEVESVVNEATTELKVENEPAMETANPWAQVDSNAHSEDTTKVNNQSNAKENELANLADKLIGHIKSWFITGNIPVKIGMLVLFGGVIALLNYANQEGYLNAPIWARMLGIIGVATVALGFAWMKRKTKRSFSLSVQGGAIGVMLLTVFASNKLYDLIPTNIGFLVSVGLIILMGVLAVIQNAKFLAIFALLAGFLAPVVFSDGGGNHVALFSYYALLNIAITAMAWWRSWRFVNLLGFFFTFGISSMWGLDGYTPEKFNTTEPFLVLFFVIYLIIPIFFIHYQTRESKKAVGAESDLESDNAPNLTDDNYDLFDRVPQMAKKGLSDPLMVDSGLVFGTPLVAFGLQSFLLAGSKMTLAYNSLGLGILYAILAYFFFKTSTKNSPLRLLGQSYIVLAATFITLFVPLAFSDDAVSGIFALEGAAAIWIGLKQKRLFSQWSGAGLQVLALMYFVNGIPFGGYDNLLSPTLFSGLILTIATFASAWLYAKERKVNYATPFYLFSLLVWLFNGIAEIVNLDQCFNHQVLSSQFIWYITMCILFAFFFITAWFIAELYNRNKDNVLNKAFIVTIFAGIASSVLFAIIHITQDIPTYNRYGFITWLVYLAVSTRALFYILDKKHLFRHSIEAILLIFVIKELNEPMGDLLSPLFVCTFLLTISTFISAWAYAKEKNKVIASIFYVVSLLLWLFNGSMKVADIDHYWQQLEYSSHMDIRYSILFAFYFITVWIIAELYHRNKDSVLRETLMVTAMLGVFLAPLFAINQLHEGVQTFYSYGLLTWLTYLAVMIRVLICIRDSKDKLRNVIQLIWLAMWPFTFTIAVIAWLIGQDIAQGWVCLSLMIPSAIAILLCLARWNVVLAPFGLRLLVSSDTNLENLRDNAVRPQANLYKLLVDALMAVLGLWWLTSLVVNGSSEPLPWIAILNPLEIGQLAVILIGVYWIWSDSRSLSAKPQRLLAIQLASFAYLTSVVLHAVHYWGGIAWDPLLLTSNLAQTSLTVLWSILGVIAWIVGSRRGQRTLWLTGAILMAIVLLKLFLIDRTNLGNVLGIASFIAYGLLCTIVGYFAPAPPRIESKAKNTES